MLKKELPGRQGFEAGLFHVLGEAAALEEIVIAVAGVAVVVLAVIDLGAILAALHFEDVVVAVAQAEGAVVEEVISHPDIDHGSLGRDGFDGGVGIDAGHHGQETGIAGADEAGAAVVAWDIRKEPSDGVISVSAFVDGFGVVVISERTAHDELALAFVASANVLVHIDVAGTGQLRAGGGEGGAVGCVNAVGGALD